MVVLLWGWLALPTPSGRAARAFLSADRACAVCGPLGLPHGVRVREGAGGGGGGSTDVLERGEGGGGGLGGVKGKTPAEGELSKGGLKHRLRGARGGSITPAPCAVAFQGCPGPTPSLHATRLLLRVGLGRGGSDSNSGGDADRTGRSLLSCDSGWTCCEPTNDGSLILRRPRGAQRRSQTGGTQRHAEVKKDPL